MLTLQVKRDRLANLKACVADKVCRELARDGSSVARCTAERFYHHCQLEPIGCIPAELAEANYYWQRASQAAVTA